MKFVIPAERGLYGGESRKVIAKGRKTRRTKEEKNRGKQRDRDHRIWSGKSFPEGRR